ncbi:WxcM-like protein [Bacteriovorax sp. BSW11_IV]|uniref:dTDP-4-dehydrorhamnose 3,5-epimerase family protein n=1 Tax=Bacteriovorax sp. BSW11_IV TaxID=1353529 RepID=UPI000389DE70|nr:dTDP-4-dehydrorhamnose 3,5-epimerase family protein [Bacteriovorax sp. BSW11_IV]EQC45843.1 WxcM-like protein [Bacteriovorax sp. BSW11_IV]
MDKIEGLVLTPLKIIDHPLGNIMHGMKASDETYKSFGEAYFSFVNCGSVKGWKLHTKMILNLVVPLGEIRFVAFDDRENSKTKGQFQEIILSRNNYQKLTVPPGVWLAFQGRSQGENLLLNMASIEHDPSEAINKSLEEIQYDWN